MRARPPTYFGVCWHALTAHRLSTDVLRNAGPCDPLAVGWWYNDPAGSWPALRRSPAGGGGVTTSAGRAASLSAAPFLALALPLPRRLPFLAAFLLQGLLPGGHPGERGGGGLFVGAG